jgi:hypothetical protein
MDDDDIRDNMRDNMLKLNPDKKKYMVFEGDVDYAYIDMITHKQFRGLWSVEETFDLLQEKEGAIYTPMYTKTICTDHLDNYVDNVNAAAAYIKPNASTMALFHRDIIWRLIAFPGDDDDYNDDANDTDEDEETDEEDAYGKSVTDYSEWETDDDL